MVPIAVVSLACRFPDAATPEALWANVLEGRRSFRALPPERLPLADYAQGVVGDADTITPVKAGLIADWAFDRERFRIPKTAFDSTDLAHWLALEVAAEAVEAGGGADLIGRERTAVVVGNTLTGEFSRAATIRLRAPFLDGVLAEALGGLGLDGEAAGAVRERFGAALRARFAEPTEEMLAGGLANTIAGRIANYFDFHGGAYLVDAACASSLVAVANAAAALASGEADAAVVAAVDLSLDPFELVGFSRNGALAKGEMLVFDARSSGFWPGEGAAAAVLMRAEDARRKGLPILATLRGWGLSTDGRGGLTRPSVGGQLAALRRAYAAAKIDFNVAGYIEAHGTGTAVGDPVEARAIAAMRDGAGEPVAIGSIKANIGHTKAAAGFAGLIKTVKALEAGIVPPHVGCREPHPVFGELGDRVRPALEPMPWPRTAAPVAGVSAFGFGGVNAHVVVEGARRAPARAAPAAPKTQDAELFLFAGASPEDAAAAVERLAGRTPSLSMAELPEAAAACAAEAGSGACGAGPCRAAVVARDSESLAERLAQAAGALRAGAEILDVAAGVFVAQRAAAPRIGFLFPGQAAPSRPDGGAWARRFAASRGLAWAVPADATMDAAHTTVAQPAVVAAALAGLRLLRACGIEADAAVGHSLGELPALAWAGVLPEEDLVGLAAARARIMAEDGIDGGGMARVALAAPDAEALARGLDLVVACGNAPAETVLSGPLGAVEKLAERARGRGVEATRLAVSHAFHSPLMAPAVARFKDHLATVSFGPVSRRVYSTITGAPLGPGDDVPALLAAQLVSPVRFADSLFGIASRSDLLIEVGPGAGLTRFARETGVPAVSVDVFGGSLAPLLTALAAAFALGADLDPAPLFADRTLRRIDLARTPAFLASPCGRAAAAPPPVPLPRPAAAAPIILPAASGPKAAAGGPSGSPRLQAVLELVSEETGLSPSSLSSSFRFLDDLHLNSLSVARIVNRAATKLGIAVPRAPADFANATLEELASALAEMQDLKPEDAVDGTRIDGVRPWVRTYGMRWAERALPEPGGAVAWTAVALAGEPHGLASVLPAAGDAAERGVLVWLGDDAGEADGVALLRACQDAWRGEGVAHLALCHAGLPLSAFARSIALEGRFAGVRMIERPRGVDARERIAAELMARCRGFAEVRLSADGGRAEPVFAPAAGGEGTGPALGPGDVVLVTGGARGIAAECAARIAARTGAAAILVGRSRGDHPEVAAALDRLATLGVRCRYVSADVADADALKAGVAAAARALGPVTALVHAAGVNEPKPFPALSAEDLLATLAPKTAGLRAAVAAAGPGLRRLVTFGSIIGRAGLSGEAHYALANAWEAVIGEALAGERPGLSVLCLEWSVWSGGGMGERTGAIEKLARAGVDALSMDDALDAFERMVLGGAEGTLVVTSRFGPVPHLDLAPRSLPVLRFVEEPVVHFPGVELIVETDLSPARDPYLSDHAVGGASVLPGVLALEAMAQAASALRGGGAPSAIENVAFAGIVMVPDGPVRVRIATLALEDGRIEAVLRAAADGFVSDRIRAVFAYAPEPAAARAFPETEGEAQGPKLDDAAALYGPVFFHGGRFRRVGRYDRVSARRLAAVLTQDDGGPWFGGFEPQTLLLPDPGARDAALHMLQAGVPHKSVLPVFVERIVLRGGTPARAVAEEREATRDTFVFDIALLDADGRPVEEWRGATFRAVDALDPATVLAAAPELAAPYIERIARETLQDDSIEVAVATDPWAGRAGRRTSALAALGLAHRVLRRPDGKPEVMDAAGTGVSLSHRDPSTLAVTARDAVGCDLETVAGFAASGVDAALPAALRAAATRLSSETGETWPVAAARVWAASEALRKLGVRDPRFAGPPASGSRGAVVLACGAGRVVTVGPIGCGPAGDVVIAVAVRTEEPRPARQPAPVPILAEA